MIVLDENVLPNERDRLSAWRLSVRQIGHDVGCWGMHDDEIIPLLRTMRQPTLVTLDADFYGRRLADRRYCLVFMSVRQTEVALFVRRFLRHPSFDTRAKRMGTVTHVCHTGLRTWRPNAPREEVLSWIE